MPLIKSSSKKALKKNIESEMESNPGKDNRSQNLAIAFDVQRRNKKKKMASGGIVKGQEKDGAPSLSPGAKDKYDRPSMQEILESKMPSGSLTPKSSSMDAIKKEDYKSQRYASGGKVISNLKDDEDHLMDLHPSSPKDEPKSLYDQEESQITSHDPDLADPHTGESEQDMRRRHSDEIARLARGGKVERPSEYPGDEESLDEHPASIAEAILKRRRKMMADGGEVESDEHEQHLEMDPITVYSHGEKEEDEEKRSKYARGGMVSSDSNKEGPGSRRDFNIDAKDEDYSDSGEDFSYKHSGLMGDEREEDSENDHDEDMISSIRRKMRGY